MAAHSADKAPQTDDQGPSSSSCVDALLNADTPPDWLVECMSRLFSSLSDPTRVRIVHAMTVYDEICVADLAKVANLSVSAVSHQLRLLRDRNLVSSRREGRMVFYRLTDEHVRTLVHTGMEHACEDCANRPRDLPSD